jgi:hypothetical protein
MSYPINYPTPQGANIQIFTANGTSNTATWIKPQGASFVWFTLIGPGGSGGTASGDGVDFGYGGGGGSGAVTNCMIPAFLIPDRLNVRVSPQGSTNNTRVVYQQKDGTGVELLSANAGSDGLNSTGGSGSGGAGGNAMSANAFTAAGFFQSIAGQAGSNGDSAQTTSTTTFLQGGVGGNGQQAASQYGYSKANTSTSNLSGYGIISPIIVSVACNQSGSSFVSNSSPRVVKNGFGCGGGGAFTDDTGTKYGTQGGVGLAVIITW